MKQNPNLNCKHFFSSLFFLFIVTFLLSGCKKIDSQGVNTNGINPQIEEFLKTPVNSGAELKLVTADLRKQLSNKNFVNDFIQWHGKPDWEKVIKIKTYDSSVVLLIPTFKDNEILAFIGVKYINGSFKYELHRKSSVVNIRKEYSYIGFNENTNKWFLNYFDPSSAKNKSDNSVFENIAPPPFCWYILIRVYCNLQENNSGSSINWAPRCYGWLEQCSDDDGNGGGGGGGGGGCTTCNPPECPAEVWYNIIPDPPCENIPLSPTVVYINNLLNLNPVRIEWLNSHQYEASVIKQMLDSNWIFIEGDDVFAVDPNAIIASRITIDGMMGNYINGPYNTAHYNHIKQHIPGYENHQNFDPIYWMHFRIQCVLIKLEHPEWSNLKIYWEASKEVIQLSLDIIGLVPVIGEVADLANGIIYTIQGDGVNATLSFAAMIPIGGWVATGTKFAKKLIIAADNSRRTLKWMKLPSNIINFGDRGLLRKILGLAGGDSRIAHHLIPWEHGIKDIIQKAAHGDFHLNEILNGIPLTAIQHNGSHAVYNQKIADKLQYLWDNFGQGGMSIQTAQTLVRNLGNDIRAWIVAHPNESINNIILP